MELERVESLFLSAIEIEGLDARRQFLDSIQDQGQDEELVNHLKRLIRAHDKALEVAKRSLFDPPSDATIDTSADAEESQSFIVSGFGDPSSKESHDHETLASGLLQSSYSPGESRARDLDGEKYEVIGELARGGMGAVLKGRDRELRRELAIKVLLDQHRNKPSMVERFVEEAQIAGQLQHPGIAPVYELGNFGDDRPFFSMKLVKGRTLSTILKQRDTPSDGLPNLLGIFEQVCQTMAYAHSRRVIHRDLKPANIMVGAFGEVQVMDWGLAKVLTNEASSAHASQQEPNTSVIRTARNESINDDSEASHTRAGSMLGTPAYMPPEQALGDQHEISERADVFGLGAILCEILTGRPAYYGDTSSEVLRKAIRGDVSDARTRLKGSGGEPAIVELALQCLEPEPKDRPKDASAVAGAMQDYFDTVQERLRDAELARVEADARAEEAIRRRRLYFVLAGLTLLAALGAGASAFVFRQQREQQRGLALSIEVEKQKVVLEKERVEAEKRNVEVQRRNAELAKETVEQEKRNVEAAKAKAEEAREVALEQQQLAEASQKLALKNEKIANQQRQLALRNLKVAEEASENRRRLLYAADMQQAGLLWKMDEFSPRRVKQLLDNHLPKGGESDLRGFEWKLCKERLAKASITIKDSVLSLGLRDDVICLVNSQAKILHYEIASGRLRKTVQIKTKLQGKSINPAISPNGMLAALITIEDKTGNRFVQVFDCDTGKPKFVFDANELKTVSFLKFTSDGRRLMCAGGKRVKNGLCWNTESGKSIARFAKPNSPKPHYYHFVPGVDATLQIGGKLQTDLAVTFFDDGPKPVVSTLPALDVSLTNAVISPSGQWIAASTRSSGTVFLRAFDGDSASVPIIVSRAQITAMAFAPDDRTFVVGGTDGKITVFRLVKSKTPVALGDETVEGVVLERVRTLVGHTEPVKGMRFDRSGQFLVSYSPDEMRTWDFANGKSIRKTIAVERRCNNPATEFSPDGKWLFLANTTTNDIELREPKSGKVIWSDVYNVEGEDLEPGTLSATFSADSQQLAVGHHGAHITVWNTQTKSRVATLRAGPSKLSTLALSFTADGKYLATGYGVYNGHRSTIAKKPELWDLESHQRTIVLDDHRNTCTGIAFDPEGKFIFTSSHDGKLRRFAASSGKLLQTEPLCPTLNGMRIVGDTNPSILAWGANGYIALHRLGDLGATRRFDGHAAQVLAANLSSDGRTLATCGEDLTLRLWSISTGREVMRVSSDRTYRSVAFSKDDSTMVAGRGHARIQGVADVWRLGN